MTTQNGKTSQSRPPPQVLHRDSNVASSKNRQPGTTQCGHDTPTHPLTHSITQRALNSNPHVALRRAVLSCCTGPCCCLRYKTREPKKRQKKRDWTVHTCHETVRRETATRNEHEQRQGEKKGTVGTIRQQRQRQQAATATKATATRSVSLGVCHSRIHHQSFFERKDTVVDTHTHTHTHIYTYTQRDW